MPYCVRRDCGNVEWGAANGARTPARRARWAVTTEPATIGQAEPMVNAFDPVWAPFDERIAVTIVATGNSEVYLINPDTGDKRNISNDPATDSQASWMPGGLMRVMFKSNRHSTGLWQHYSVNVFGGDLKLHNWGDAVGSNNHDASSSLTPMGEWVAFSSENSEGKWRVILRDLHSSEFIVFEGGLGVDVRSPRWGPWGESIAFLRSTNRAIREWDIVVAAVDGSRETKAGETGVTDVRLIVWRPL